MKIIEEQFLKETITKLNDYHLKNSNTMSFYKNIDKFASKSLQDLSFESDLSFFDEVSFILSIISSIVSHPHILNKTEDAIIRAETAANVTNDMFLNTMKNPKLWKNGENGLVPEYVCYYFNVDDLKIYENIFVVMVIKLIEAELNKYSEFYVSTIQEFDGKISTLEKSETAAIALGYLKKLSKKLHNIKNTKFYREINKGFVPLKHIHPTNILLKDRLYNYVFKFYRKLVTYNEKTLLLKDLRLYYYINLLKVFKEKGYSLKSSNDDIMLDENGSIIIKPVSFENEKFVVDLKAYNKYIGFEVNISNKYVENNNTTKHLVLFDSQASFADTNKLDLSDKKYLTIEALSIWNVAYLVPNLKKVFTNIKPEMELITEWLNTKTTEGVSSKRLYTDYCPICKGQNVSEHDGILVCDDCSSQYMFFKNDESKDSIWLTKIRRS